MGEGGRLATAVLPLLVLLSSAHSLSRVVMTEDGGYTNIVIKIRSEVSEDDCPDILRGIKVLTVSLSSLSKNCTSKFVMSSLLRYVGFGSCLFPCTCA
jgi:hypothetical protein